MLKKKVRKPVKKPFYHKVIKQNFPTFYNKPLFAVIVLIALILIVWTLQR